MVLKEQLMLEQSSMNAVQKSAEGMVLKSQEGLNNEEDETIWLDHGYCARRCLRGCGVKAMVASKIGKENPDDILVDQH